MTAGSMSSPFEMMRSRKRSADGAAPDHMRAWTQARFKLTENDTVMVSADYLRRTGCPPIETHIAFWTDQGRHHFKVFKPLAEVTEDDLPPAFMKNALIWIEGVECSCC